MNNNPKNIDDILKNSLSDYLSPPSQTVRKSMSEKIKIFNFFRFYPGKFNVFYLSGIIILIFFIAGIVLSDDNKTPEHYKTPETNNVHTEEKLINKQKEEIKKEKIISETELSKKEQAEKSYNPEFNDTKQKEETSIIKKSEKKQENIDEKILTDTTKHKEYTEIEPNIESHDKHKKEIIYDTIIDTKKEIITDTVREEVQKTIRKRRGRR